MNASGRVIGLYESWPLAKLMVPRTPHALTELFVARAEQVLTEAASPRAVIAGPYNDPHAPRTLEITEYGVIIRASQQRAADEQIANHARARADELWTPELASLREQLPGADDIRFARIVGLLVIEPETQMPPQPDPPGRSVPPGAVA